METKIETMREVVFPNIVTVGSIRRRAGKINDRFQTHAKIASISERNDMGDCEALDKSDDANSFEVQLRQLHVTKLEMKTKM